MRARSTKSRRRGTSASPTPGRIVRCSASPSGATARSTPAPALADGSSASPRTEPHASSRRRRRVTSGRSPSPIVQVAARRTVDDGKPMATTASLSKERDSDRGHAVPAPSLPTAGENSVYRIAPDGAFRELYRDKKLVLGLHRSGDRVLVGTGLDGQLIEVNEANRERTELARLDHGQAPK